MKSPSQNNKLTMAQMGCTLLLRNYKSPILKSVLYINNSSINTIETELKNLSLDSNIESKSSNNQTLPLC